MVIEASARPASVGEWSRRRGDFRRRRARQLAADRRRYCRQRTCRLERGRIPRRTQFEPRTARWRRGRGNRRRPSPRTGSTRTSSSTQRGTRLRSASMTLMFVPRGPGVGSVRPRRASWEPAADLSLAGRERLWPGDLGQPGGVTRSWCGSRTTSCLRSSTRASGRRAGPGNPISKSRLPGRMRSGRRGDRRRRERDRGVEPKGYDGSRPLPVVDVGHLGGAGDDL